MIRQKQPPSRSTAFGLLKSFGKGVIALEVGALCISYIFYRKINRDPSFRYTLYTSNIGYPILESYYKLGETLNSDLKIREKDFETWSLEGKSV